MKVQKASINKNGILISAIVLIVSILLLIDRLLATGPIQLILENGKAVPVEGISYFSLNDVLFFIITAWLGGMSFLYIILSTKEKEAAGLERDVTGGVMEKESPSPPVVDMLEGDEKTIFQEILDTDTILQRELILKTGFSEPKVSRLLDKLERKGLIIRQRNGMGNRILLKKV